MAPDEIRLADLAKNCRFYAERTSFDTSLGAFRDAVWPRFDPNDPSHRVALFTWLNAWGCRQFTKAHHATIAAPSLVSWVNKWGHLLPGPDAELTELPPDVLRSCASAYDDLRWRRAGRRNRGDQGIAITTFGPTGAAKTLFALRPSVFPPWDRAIRALFAYDEGGTSYCRYLTNVATQLKELARRNGMRVCDLPAAVGRPDSSPPKLIDEYNWIAIPRRLNRRR